MKSNLSITTATIDWGGYGKAKEGQPD